jgi:Zn-finger nucleic acid-binding protein
MDEIGAETIASRPELEQTLWHCHRCAVLVAIYSVEIVELAICPICCDVKLDHRGSFESILGIASRARLPVVS